MAGEALDAQECVLMEELTMVLNDHRQAITDNFDKKLTDTNTTLQQFNDSIAMIITCFDRVVNYPPNHGRVDPCGADHEQEEFVADDKILRQEQDTFDARQ